MTQDYLSHHGIDGMHWGIRRYQNEDGTRTPLGQRHRREIEGTEGTRESTGSKVKSFVKNNAGTIAKVALATAAVAGTAYLISRNRGAINSVIKNVSGRTINSLNSAKSTVNTGKDYVGKAFGKVRKTVKDIHNSKGATAFRNQANKTGKKISDAVKDPKTRAAAKTYASAYGKGAVDLGKKIGKIGVNVASGTKRRVEKAINDAANGKKPKFVKTKIALGTLGAVKVAKAVNKAKTEKEIRDFARQYKKDYNERKNEKYGGY